MVRQRSLMHTESRGSNGKAGEAPGLGKNGYSYQEYKEETRYGDREFVSG